MFAIGFKGIDITNASGKSFFNIKMTRYDIVKGNKVSTKIAMQPCTEAHWQPLGKIFVQNYHDESLNTFLCPPKNFQLEVRGKFTS